MLYFKFGYQEEHVIKMKIGRDLNYIGNSNCYSNYLKDFPWVNQYFQHLIEKQKIRNCK
jgi:hypothetical protein